MEPNELNIDCRDIYAVGDIHGEYSSLIYIINSYSLKDDCIIVCGDCGLGFSSLQGVKTGLRKLQQACRKRNVRVVMVRGNHDDPAYFAQGLANTSHIIAVPDYTVVNGSILCVGGGISIDRLSRIQSEEKTIMRYLRYHRGASHETARGSINRLYWPDEAPVYDPERMDAIKDKGVKISHVITHTAPSFCELQTKGGIANWMKADPKLEQDLVNERKSMDLLYARLKEDGHPLSTWTYGHFHQHWCKFIDGVRFTMLDCTGGSNSIPDWIQIVRGQETEEK